MSTFPFFLSFIRIFFCVASFHCAQQREEEAAPEIGASSPFLQQQRHLVPVEIFKEGRLM
jgi:hypothetical protein